MALILYKQGTYMLWSTVCDAPLTYGLTYEQLCQEVEARDGAKGLELLPERLQRAHASGSSYAPRATTFDQEVAGNRAGYGERQLTPEQVYQIFMVEQRAATPEDGGLTREQVRASG